MKVSSSGKNGCFGGRTQGYYAPLGSLFSPASSPNIQEFHNLDLATLCPHPQPVLPFRQSEIVSIKGVVCGRQMKFRGRGFFDKGNLDKCIRQNEVERITLPDGQACWSEAVEFEFSGTTKTNKVLIQGTYFVALKGAMDSNCILIPKECYDCRS